MNRRTTGRPRKADQTTLRRRTGRRRQMPLFARRNANSAKRAERPRSRAFLGKYWFARGLLAWPDATEALAALVRAWVVTTIATTLLLAALALAPMWDGAIFLHALRDTLGRDSQLAPPIDESADDAPATAANSRMPADKPRQYARAVGGLTAGRSGDRCGNPACDAHADDIEQAHSRRGAISDQLKGR
jgi:hypothetical protein